ARMSDLVLVSHKLCPYVQRAAIALAEKAVPFRRRDVDLAKKPDWFLAVSPLGKTPVLLVPAPQARDAALRSGAGADNSATAICESAVILEYLEETQADPLHPAEPLARAEHRAFIEFGSAILNDIAGLYGAADAAAFAARASALRAKFERIEERLV